MHLAELVRMAFIAGTSNNDQLKLAGIKTLFVSIMKFFVVKFALFGNFALSFLTIELTCWRYDREHGIDRNTGTLFTRVY